jgi:2,4-dienoyl-CoA reductase-like NADH-dependent reductase (Old Yellow Enzyme family)
MTNLFQPLTFRRGLPMKNRFMLAPLTNCQSHDDGVLSEHEFHWLTMRAKGGFGLTSTCAAHVQARGQGFPGQLGIFSDKHVEGLTRLAAAIKRENSLAFVQLHHAGIRAPAGLIRTKAVGPSDNAETNARALSEDEVEQLIEDFVAAAKRAERAGFDGVEVHGAHGYILCAFLSPEINHRTDRFGGTLENRARIVFEIVNRIRQRCRPDFTIGIRLSPERFGMKLDEIREVAQQLLSDGQIDLLDMSLWDVFKEPQEEARRGRSLLSYFTELKRGDARLGAAGKIYSGADVQHCLNEGLDFAVIGRAAILHHDFPRRVQQDPAFTPVSLPVSSAYLHREGLSDAFVTYMRNWKGFVADEAA